MNGVPDVVRNSIVNRIKLNVIEKFGDKYYIVSDSDVALMNQKAAQLQKQGCSDEVCMKQIADAIDADEPPADKPSAGKTAGDKSTATTVPPKKPVSYKDDLVPLMKARCYECHSGEKPKDGIGFDHMEELIKTTGKRAVVMKGDPAKSTAFIAVMKADTSKKRMPPPKTGDRLTPEEAGVIEAWIKEGAKLDN